MTLLIGTMLVLLALGTPVAFAIGLAAAAQLFLGPMLTGSPTLPPVVLAQMTASGANEFILLAVPFFIFAGELMNAGGITKRLIVFAESLVGSTRGGLAYVVVIVNMIMAGVSGAAIADAAAVGSVMIPSMVRSGYRRGFAGGGERRRGYGRSRGAAQRGVHHLCRRGQPPLGVRGQAISGRRGARRDPGLVHARGLLPRRPRVQPAPRRSDLAQKHRCWGCATRPSRC